MPTKVATRTIDIAEHEIDELEQTVIRRVAWACSDHGLTYVQAGERFVSAVIQDVVSDFILNKLNKGDYTYDEQTKG